MLLRHARAILAAPIAAVPRQRLEFGGQRRGAGGEDGRGYLAEADAPAGRARRRGGDRYRVAVLEEGPRLAVDRDWFRTAPGELEERVPLGALGTGDRAGGEQVAGADGRAVHRQVREHLRGRPVH